MNPNEQPIVTNNIPPTVPTVKPSPYTPINNNSHKKVGPIIAILVIVLVLVIAALYLFASRINQQTTLINAENTPITNTSIPNNEAAASESVQAVINTSDDLQSLQNDLNVSTDGLDSQNF